MKHTFIALLALCVCLPVGCGEKAEVEVDPLNPALLAGTEYPTAPQPKKRAPTVIDLLLNMTEEERRQYLAGRELVTQMSIGGDEKKPFNADHIIESAIRITLGKPEGKLTEADLDKVRVLWLNDTKITDVGLKEVAKLEQLRMLWLCNTKITDVGLWKVTKLTQLEELWLRDTKVTKVGVAELQKALPKCKIDHGVKK